MAYDKEKITQDLINNIEGIEDITSFEDAALTVAPALRTLYDWELHELHCIQNALANNRNENCLKKRTDAINHKRLKRGSGYIYLIHCIGSNYYKIGVSKLDPDNRISNLQSGCPYELRFVDIFYSPQYSLVEHETHERYKKYNVRGEWFELNENQLLCLKSELQEKSNKQMSLF